MAVIKSLKCLWFLAASVGCMLMTLWMNQCHSDGGQMSTRNLFLVVSLSQRPTVLACLLSVNNNCTYWPLFTEKQSIETKTRGRSSKWREHFISTQSKHGHVYSNTAAFFVYYLGFTFMMQCWWGGHHYKTPPCPFLILSWKTLFF